MKLPSLHYKMYVQVMGGDTAATPTFIHFFLVCAHIRRMLNRRKLKHKTRALKNSRHWHEHECLLRATVQELRLLSAVVVAHQHARTSLPATANLPSSRYSFRIAGLLFPPFQSYPSHELVAVHTYIYTIVKYAQTLRHTDIANTTTTVQNAHNIECLPSYF